MLMLHWAFAGLAVALAGCAAAGGWTRPGADAAATAAAYDDCRAGAMEFVSPEAGIDQDILASRSSDIQRSSIMRREAHNVQEDTRGRANAIIAACMQSKGFAKGR
ncbi:MAG: hypothetical protein ACM3JG_08780 [Thiohalocapsa sp.]